jgi:hypothetical protein
MGAVYRQLSFEERRRIERWRHAKVPVDEMARVLKRCRSTIFASSGGTTSPIRVCQVATDTMARRRS